MIKIEKMNRKEFWQCSSCLKSTEKVDMYEIVVGKNLNQQSSSTRLCSSCLRDLEHKITLLEMNKERSDAN